MPAPRSTSTDRSKARAFGRAMVLAAALAWSAGSSKAALIGTCTILINTTGTLTTNAGLTSLSSRNPGGVPARATIISSGGGGVLPSLLCSLDFLINCFAVTVVPPTAFSSSPAGGGTGVAFASNFDVAGSFALISRIVLNGSYAFDFNMSATRSSGMFPVGAYQAQPTVRCE